MIHPIPLSCIIAAAFTMPVCSATTEEQSGSPRNIPSVLSVEPRQEREPRMLALKTNAIVWGAGILNIEGEIQLSENISLALPLWYCPWFISGRHALRVGALQPEGRWWFRETGKGHFAGIHASIAWYNLKWGNYRYQDTRRPLLGIGITYGYALELNKSWGLEFSVGFGYLNTRYDRFYNTPNGQLADIRQTSYFGPDHLSVSVVYHLPL